MQRPASGTTAACLLPLPANAWTGDAACFIPRPDPAPVIAGTTPKPNQQGTWLKSSAPARLRIVAAGPSSAALELSLPTRVLVRHPLSELVGAADHNNSSNSSSSSPHHQPPSPSSRLMPQQRLLLIPASSCPPASVLFAFRFFDHQERAAFEQCMHALHAAAADQLKAMHAAQAVAAAGGGDQGRHAAGVAPNTSTAYPAQTGGQPQHSAAAEAATESDVDIKAAIQRYLQDNRFGAYVSRVEQLWDEVEAECAAAAEGGGGDGQGGG